MGTTSTAQAVKLTNTGSASLKITSVSASGDYKQTNNCGGSVAAGNSCTISVTFAAKALGSRTGKLTVKDDAGSGTQTASLSGTGVKLTVTLSPTTLNFKTQRIKTVSITRAGTLTNNSSAKLVISSISASDPYSQTNTCGSSVSAGGSCTISVTFAPKTEQVFTGGVTIKDNGGTQKLALTGVGGFPAFSANLKTVSFGKLAIGSTSPTRVVKVTNKGSDKLFIDRISTRGDFGQTNTCEPYVNPGITCTISLTFTPTTLSASKGTLTIRHELGVYKVSLRGVGLPAATGASPSGANTGSAGPSEALGPGESSGGRGLSGTSRLIAAFGLLLLLAGGGFLWLTRDSAGATLSSEEPTVDEGGSALAALEPSPETEGEDEDVLEWFLSGSEDEAQGAEDPGGNGSQREATAPFDWETEQGSHLT